MSKFGKNERRFRENKKMSMQEVAHKVGVTKGSVNMWENNDVVPREEVLVKLANLYETSIDALLGYEPNQKIVENGRLSYIQRGLSELNDADLEKAENMLKAVFKEAFECKEEDDDI